MSRFASLILSISSLALTACATTGSSASLSAPSTSSVLRAEPSMGSAAARDELRCSDCDAIPMPADVTQAIESRIALLKERGGDCTRYGSVLESSYRSGRITIRPFMWRVGTRLASAQAKPNGDMMLAREIDSLNVGVRTVDDVLWSMEHEAARITFELASGNEASEEKADQIVRACRTDRVG